MSRSKILFKLTGSIACFKAAALISNLVQSGCEVQTVATSSALKFLGEATLEGLTSKRVLKDTFAAGDLMGHLNWAKWADLVIVYPATANSINKLANGVGDDLLSTLFLAHDFKKPYLIAPAMNTRMLEHPATKDSLSRLRNYGVHILNSESGTLACGDVGAGRLVEPEEALKEIFKQLTVTSLSEKFASETPSAVKRIVVTLGGTREAIDSVRSITNTSTGATGVAIAEYLADVGHSVTAVCGSGSKIPKNCSSLLAFSDFESLNSILERELANNSYDTVIHLAAVSDYSVESIEADGTKLKVSSESKIESSRELKINLKKNFKILDRLRSYSKNKNIQIIGFKLTAGSNAKLISEKLGSLLDKDSADFIVHNELSTINSISHPATIIDRSGETLIATLTKQELAENIEKLIREASL